MKIVAYSCHRETHTHIIFSAHHNVARSNKSIITYNIFSMVWFAMFICKQKVRCVCTCIVELYIHVHTHWKHRVNGNHVSYDIHVAAARVPN